MSRKWKLWFFSEYCFLKESDSVRHLVPSCLLFCFRIKILGLELLCSHSVVSDSLWPPGTIAHKASLSCSISLSLLKLMSIESVMPSKNLILCHPLNLLPSIFPSITVFPNKSALCIRWPEYWSFSFHLSSYNEYSGFISFRTDWFDLLAVQGTLKRTWEKTAH